jgi:hypothetical protein
LNKINKKRNLLEHEYKNPSIEEVEDALDVAILFINYTNKYISSAMIECELDYNKDLWNKGPVELFDKELKCVTITLDWRNCKLTFDSATKNIDGIYENIIKELTANQTGMMNT